MKLEPNQTHLEFSVPTFGASEQAARLSCSLYKFLWISRSSAAQEVPGCAVSNPFCSCKLRESSSILGHTAPALQLFHDLSKPGHAALPGCPKPMSETRTKRNHIPASATDRNFEAQTFPKKALSLGKHPRTTPRAELWCRAGGTSQQSCSV